jgi:ATP-binding cassette, subfamily C, bacterial LapB
VSNSQRLGADDALLQSLVLFTKLYHKPFTAEALIAGLPVDSKNSDFRLFSDDKPKSLFSRAANRAGLKSALVKKELDAISSLQLPMIIALKNDEACILDSFDKQREKCKIIFATEEPTEEWVSVESLKDEYDGYGFLLKKPFDPSERAAEGIHFKHKHWFWDTLKLSKGLYKDVLYASLLVNIFVLVSPLFTMSVYDRVIPSGATETLWVFAFGALVVYMLDTFLKYTRGYLLESAGKKSDVIISSILFEKILDIQIAHHPKSVGSFASNLKDFDAIRSFLTNATMTAIIDIPFSLILLCVICYIGGWLVMAPITMMIAILAYALLLRNPLKNSIESTHKAVAAKNSILIESLQNIETLKTLGAYGHAQWSYEESSGEIAQKSLKSKMLSSSITNMTGFLVQLTTVIVVVAGVYMIGEHSLSMGGLIAIVILSSRTVAPMGQAAALISNYSDAKSAYEVLDSIIQKPGERPQGKKFITRKELGGDIEFRNISFSYPEAQMQALTNVSFKIKPNEKVAIIGRIGSGKSTIAKLLLKLYEAQSGSILIDGIDIKQIDPADLRKNIGYVSQDISLFSGTVKENISYRAMFANDEQIIRASIASGADEFIKKHPLGYEMPIGERGVGLSGGQRQSIGIARALLTNPPILIMDEPSNAMDALSENRLIENMRLYLADKTAILVTQKTSLLTLVDRIIVMSDGGIYMDDKAEIVLEKLKGAANES